MRCPDCGEIFQVLEPRIRDFTTSILGCPVKGRWPNYTSRVYIDNVELLQCGCGICTNVPDLGGLHLRIFGSDPPRNIAAGKIAVDPYSGLVYLGTWDEEVCGWILSQHREQ